MRTDAAQRPRPRRDVKRGRFTFRVEDCPELPNFWEMFEAGWEQHSIRLIEAMIRDGSVFVDVGAWIGPLTLYAAALGARVIAVEPDPIASSALERNVEANQEWFAHPVSIWKGAIVADTQRPVGIETYTGQMGDSMTRIVVDGGSRVKSWTLPTVLDREGVVVGDVALAKIDVEGYEMTLMPTLAPWLGAAKVPVFVSFHGKNLPRDWFSLYERVTKRVEYISPRTQTPWGDLTALPSKEKK